MFIRGELCLPSLAATIYTNTTEHESSMWTCQVRKCYRAPEGKCLQLLNQVVSINIFAQSIWYMKNMEIKLSRKVPGGLLRFGRPVLQMTRGQVITDIIIKSSSRCRVLMDSDHFLQLNSLYYTLPKSMHLQHCLVLTKHDILEKEIYNQR